MTEKLLLELETNPMLVYDVNTLNILEVNQEFCDTYGYSHEEIQQKELTLENLHVPGDIHKLKQLHANRNGAGIMDSGVWHHLSKNNKRFYVKASSQKIEHQESTARLVSLVDVTDLVDLEDHTEQHKAQEKLRRNEMLFENLFANAPQPIALVDAENRVERVNRSFEKLFGFSEDELSGENIDDFIVSESEDSSISILSAKRNGRGKIYTHQKRYTKDGTPLDVLVGVIPIVINGELIAGFGMYNDITEQKETHRKLQQSLDEKRVLIEEVHHRVKNNLAVISGLLQMQTLHVDDERLTKYIRNSQLRIQSMSIVHEMLYKSETLSQINMDAYVNKLASVISDTLGPADKTINTIVDSDEIILNVNQAIPAALIISELITNAYEFAFEGQKSGKVMVSLSSDNENVSVSVRDNGVGLPDDFEEMRQKSLGLSLVENLCMQLETNIAIESGDWGTRFGFTFEKNDAQGSSSSNRV